VQQLATGKIARGAFHRKPGEAWSAEDWISFRLAVSIANVRCSIADSEWCPEEMPILQVKILYYFSMMI
jgi:hypothetical protein